MCSLQAALGGLAALMVSCFVVSSAVAQSQSPAVKPDVSSCPGLIAQHAPRMPRIIPAAFRPVALKPQDVRITYLGHSSFLLESSELVRIVTDYNGYNVPPMVPDVVTMNHAHSSHYTDTPDPRIAHVLRGWGPSPEQPARYDLQVKDVHIRNVPTNIRRWDGTTEKHGNSIFTFEIGSLCVAHLGHLHHTLNQQQLNEMGKIDVLLVPVDGGATLDLDGMVEVLGAIKAQLMIPMHYFSTFTLQRFIDRVKGKYDIEYGETSSLIVSRATLPQKPKVVVLQGR
jgi:L-ascorbate metabolism protein UlaG (beta-lactamase superfamily)